jgi:peroxiredoxin family protein
MNTATQTLDAPGLNCSLPILRTRKILKAPGSGDTLQVSATDPGSIKDIELPMPTMAMSLPGFEDLATSLMQRSASCKGVASIEELSELSIDAGVKLVACQMTVDLFGWKQQDFIDEIDEWVGAASFLPRAQNAQVNLFI